MAVKNKQTQTPQEMEPLPDRAWLVEDVMRYMQVSKPMIYKFMKEDGLPFFQVGDVRRFDPYEVRKWFLKLQQTA